MYSEYFVPSWHASRYRSFRLASLSKHLSLSITLQSLFNSEPALDDVDVLARIEIVDPDGTPGTGDEFFRTVENDTKGVLDETAFGDAVKEEEVDLN